MGTYNIEVRIPGIQGRGLQGPKGDPGEKGEPGSAAPESIIVAANIAKVQTCATGISDIGTVATNISNVNLIGSNIASVTSVASSIANVNTVSGALPTINTVAGSIGNVNAVGANISSVTAIAPYTSELSTVSSNITSVVAVAADLPNIDAAPGYAAEAKQWAIGSPTEPSEFSAKWWAHHHGLICKGPYNAATTYNQNEWVTYSAGGVMSGYVSLVNGNVGTALTDPTKWMLMYQILSSQALACREVTWVVPSAIPANTVITLPGSLQYTVGAKALFVRFDGFTFYRGLQFTEIGAVGANSSRIMLLCEIPAGSEFSAWAVFSSDVSVGVCNESVWTTSVAIPSGTTVTIPGTFIYTNGSNQLMVSVDGSTYFKGKNYSEAGIFGTSSNQITFLCDIPAGSEIMCWSLITGSGGGGSGSLEPRVSVLEANVSNLQNNVAYVTSTP